VKRLKHAFCHKATFSRIVLKAELAFAPYSLLKSLSLCHSRENGNLARIGINKRPVLGPKFSLSLNFFPLSVEIKISKESFFV
ncbi:MAG: hypothetical protein OXH36_02620, partial [Bdellovibrionales bacterium]|nr:hypothetical protein [Bdellovibrionales bacterium]